MDSVIKHVQQLTQGADAAARHSISAKLRELAASIETPREAIIRHTYFHAQLPPILQIAVDLGLFALITESKEPLTVNTIADRCGADRVLIGRILRFLAAAHVVAETDNSTFTANNTTTALATHSGTASIKHGFLLTSPCFQALPAFLKANGYRSPMNVVDTPFQTAWHTEKYLLDWMQTQPMFLQNFLGMLPSLENAKPWTSVAPLAEKLERALATAEDGPAPPVLFVDVGGGGGGQCEYFRKATADRFAGRVILQDLPQTVAAAPERDGVEKMEQDFFKEQAVKGAVFYYLRNVLHDHTDERCINILKRQSAAMGPNSTLLIDELVLPNKGASTMATQFDFVMLSLMAAIERSEAEWRTLLEKAGLEVKSIRRYDNEMEYAVIEACVPGAIPTAN